MGLQMSWAVGEDKQVMFDSLVNVGKSKKIYDDSISFFRHRVCPSDVGVLSFRVMFSIYFEMACKFAGLDGNKDNKFRAKSSFLKLGDVSRSELDIIEFYEDGDSVVFLLADKSHVRLFSCGAWILSNELCAETGLTRDLGYELFRGKHAGFVINE